MTRVTNDDDEQDYDASDGRYFWIEMRSSTEKGCVVITSNEM